MDTNQRNILIAGAALVILLVGGYFLFFNNPSLTPEDNSQDQSSGEVRSRLTEFGTKLKNVSLTASQDQLKTAIQQNYSEYVTPELLAAWLASPTAAPGRKTSSPSPERIEITETTKVNDNEYNLKGDILEFTSSDANNPASRIPVAVTVQNRDGKWLISSFIMGTPQAPSQGSFDKQGTITKGTTTATQNKWYITYDTGTKKELDTSSVNFSNVYAYNGMIARVEGNETSGVVKVSKLTIINGQKDDLIWVATPLPNQTVKSPLTVSGRARGNWFFEASFPVKLLDSTGKQIALGVAQAQGEWMTTEYIGFTVSLPFTKPAAGTTGTLVLEKDNPSGLPQNANELRIPVKF